MKKYLFVTILLLTSITVFAQNAPFVIYTPAPDIRSSNNNYNNYYNYNNNYDNLYNIQPRQQEHSSQTLSTRGYYIKNNQWVPVLLKVKVTEDNVYVVGIKRSTTGWSNESIRAYSTELMQKEIKDNFDYYIGDYVYGKIYF